MRRLIAIASGTIALLFGTSVALIALWTSGPGDPGSSPGAAAPTEPFSPPLPGDVPATASPAAARAQPAVAADEAPASAPRDDGAPRRVTRRASRESLPPAPSRAVARSLRRQFRSGHGDLRASLARCTPPNEPRSRPAVLMLELETLEREVRIVDARAHARGDSSDAFVACAQGVLRNRVIATPTATVGGRSWMSIALAFYETDDLVVRGALEE